MFIGHGFAAALMAVLLIRLALPERRDREVQVAAVAFVFGILPDVDMLYTVAEALLRLPNDPSVLLSLNALLGVFWDASVVHRGLTHSILAMSVLSLFCYRLAIDRRAGGGGVAPRQFSKARFFELTTTSTRRLLGLLAVLSVFAGGLGEFLVFWLFVLLAAALTLRLVGTGTVDPTELLVASWVGMASHPLGDLWMGPPFRIFAPLPYETTQYQPLFGIEGVHYPLSLTIEATICLVGLLVLTASYRGWSLRETVLTVFEPRPDAAFAVAASLLVVGLTLPVGFPVLYRTYEIAIIGVVVPVVLLVAGYHRWADVHTAVSLIYVTFLTVAVVGLTLAAIALVLEVPAVAAALESAVETLRAVVDYLRSVYDGRGLARVTAPI